MKEITIYYRDNCPYCVKAKELFKSKGLQITHEIDITTSPELRKEMIEKSGRMSVPQIFIDGKHIGGYDDLYTYNQEGHL